jgi:hypothetical protein
MWNEVVVAQFEVQFQELSEGIEKNHEKPQAR